MQETKQCKKCGSTLPVTEFYRQRSMSDGLFSKCKTCTKRDVRENRAAKADYYREFDRQRANLPHRVEARAAYAVTPEGLAAGSKAKRAYIERNPIKRAAHNAVSSAILTGKMARKPCEVCGDTKAQAHHDNYTNPLDVRWLCTKHHAEWHKHNTPICPDQEQAA